LSATQYSLGKGIELSAMGAWQRWYPIQVKQKEKAVPELKVWELLRILFRRK
jgi:hypothetical protein